MVSSLRSTDYSIQYSFRHRVFFSEKSFLTLPDFLIFPKTGILPGIMTPDSSRKKKSVELENFFSSYNFVEFQKNQVVLRPDDSLDNIYYIKEGYVRQYAVSSEGEEFTLNIYRPGSYFAIALSFEQETNNHYFETLTSVEMYKAPKKDVVAFLKKNPVVLFDLFTRISSGMSELTLRMESLVFGTARAKVAATLYLNARRFGKNSKNDVTIDFPLTHLQIANMTGVTRETVSIEMMNLKKEKIITYHGQRVTVFDMKKLNKASSLSQYI